MMPFHTDRIGGGLQVTVHAPNGHFFAGSVRDLGEDGESWGGRFMGKTAGPGMPGGAKKFGRSEAEMVRWLVNRYEKMSSETEAIPEVRRQTAAARRCPYVAQENKLSRLEVENASYPDSHFKWR